MSNTKHMRCFVLLVMMSIPMWQAYTQSGDLVLQDTTIAEAATFTAGNSITAGPNFTIAGSGDATFITGGSIYLNPGIVIVQGGRLQTINDSTVDVETPDSPAVPEIFSLHQNYPNPFNPATTFTFDLPRSSHVVLAVYNVVGQKVAKVVDDTLPAGSHSRMFDASHLPSGVYIYRITAGAFVESKRMLLVK